VTGDCDRARQWASTELDGELSTFEHALLRAHLAGCASCNDFAAAIRGLSGTLRSAPLVPFEAKLDHGRNRRRFRMRLAPAAAAMAVAAVGLGSILASTAVRSGSVGTGRVAPTPPVTADLASLDTMDLRTSDALARLNAFQQTAVPASQRSLRGGPVVQER
jgi:predicted anti-sigma-YlaC factor YlaD